MKLKVFIWLILTPVFLSAQDKGKPFSRYFSPKEYNGDTQNWGILHDKNGLLHVANQRGILQYDGSTWTTIPIPDKKTVRSLALDSSNHVWAGAISEVGYVSGGDKKELQYVSINQLIDSSHRKFGEVWSIEALKNEVFILSDNSLFRYRNGEIKTWDKTGEYFYLLMPFYNQMLLQEIGQGLKIIIGDSLVDVSGSQIFKQIRIHAFIPVSNNGVIVGTRDNGLYSVKISITDKKAGIQSISHIWPEISDYLKKHTLYHGISVGNGEFAFATLRGGVLHVSSEGKIIDIYAEHTAIGAESSYFLSKTPEGSLWVALDNGLARLEPENPFRQWDATLGLKGTVIDVNRYQGTIYAATATGVYYMEDKKNNQIQKFNKLEGIKEQTWCFLQTPDFFKNGDTALLVGSSTGIFSIKGNKAELIGSLDEMYTINLLSKFKNKLVMGKRDGCYIAGYQNGEIQNVQKIKEINDEVRSITEDENGDVWIGINYKGIVKLHFLNNDVGQYSYQLFDTLNGLPNLWFIQTYNYSGKPLFLTETGLMHFNPGKNHFETYHGFDRFLGKNPPGIFNLSVYENGEILINTQYLLHPYGSGYYVDSSALLRLPVTSVQSDFLDKNGCIWLGSSDGLYQYTPKHDKNYLWSFKTLIRKVFKADGTIVFYGGKQTLTPVLENKFNSLTFQYAAPFFDLENEILYSYKLDGFDGVWSEWTIETRKEYTNLFEGSYTFRVKSKNIYGVEGEEDRYSFIVQPPWYRARWTLGVYILLTIILVRLIIVLRTRKISNERDKLEKIVIERTAQINMQKEELMSQADQLRVINTELEKLGLVIRETANAVSIFDPVGNFEWVNEGFTRMYGYTLEEFKNEKAFNIFDCDIPETVKQRIKGCIQNKKTVIYSFFTTTKAGEGLWAQTTLTPILDDLGGIKGLIAIDSDITKLKDAELEIVYQKEKIERQSILLEQKNAELEKLSIVARETDNAIIIMDARGNFEWVNEGFTRLYGYTIDQLVSEKSHNIIGASANVNIRDLINVWYGDKKPIMYESLNTSRAGKLIWAQTTLTPILDTQGNLVRMVAIDTEITRLKDAQRQIEEQRNELEKANATKDKFFGIIAHDLRSPASSLLSLINIVVEEYKNLDNQQIERYLKAIQEASKKTFALLENLLDWSRIQKGVIQYNPTLIHLSTLINEAVSLHAEIADKKNIKILSFVSPDAKAWGDENMIRTVLRNLISNAVKFSFSGNKVSVFHESNQYFVTLKICDEGIGISPEDIDKLFRIDIHHTTVGTQKEKGTGLGLVLCKEFTERNGGKIWVESKPEKGTCFYFTIPSPEQGLKK